MQKLTPKRVDTLSDERLAREVLWRTWFPSDLKFEPRGMTDGDIDRVVKAFTSFCEANVRVKRAGRELPLRLTPAQQSTIRDVVSARNVIILKARQVGFSTLLSAFVLWCAMAAPDRQIYILSKGQREARAFLSKSRYAYRKFERWVQERGPKLLDRTLERMTFDNDSLIVSSQSASDPIRGETAWMAIVDEWASINDQEGAWASVEPTADLGGRIIGLSTAKGEGNFFHWLWTAAESGNSNFLPVFHSWKAVPERDGDWYDEKVANNPRWFIAQEYPTTPEEAFVGSGNPFFDLDLVRKMQVVEPLGFYRVEHVDSQGNLVDDAKGEFTCWERPSKKRAYVIGADVAQGLEHGDWSVAFVMDAKTQNIVGQWRGHINPNDFGEQILAGLGRLYNDAVICVESNNHGGTTIHALLRVDYPNLYRRHTKLQTKEKILNTYGFLTTKSSKIDLVDGVDKWMRSTDGAKDQVTIHELKTFVRSQTGNSVSLHGSPHDDCVMSLGLTVEASKYAVENNLDEPKLDNTGSIDWWVDRLDREKRGERRRMAPVF